MCSGGNYYTKKINSLILKYSLDENFPNFSKQLKATECLEKLIEQKAREGVSLHFLYEKETDWAAISYMTRGITGITHGKFGERIPENAMIYTLDFPDSALKTYADASYTNIYDYFLCQEIVFEEEWYRIGGPYSDFNVSSMIYRDNNGVNLCPLQIMYLRRDAEMASSAGEKEKYIRDALFLAIFIKDFVTARSLIESYEQIEGKNDYCALWAEIEEVIAEIQSAIKSRKHRDIFMYWIDAVSFEASVDMAYLQTQIQNGICYKNAFTVTENTKPTFKSIFCQIKQVEDRAYRILPVRKENTIIVNEIIKEGYDFKILSGYMTDVWLDESFFTKQYFERNSTCTEIIWNAVEYLLTTNAPQFLLCHFLFETHFPYFSADMSADTFTDDAKRVVTGMKYVDKQLAFYNSLIGNDNIKIYMSDHGLGDFCTKYHVLFNICGRGFAPEVMDELISSLDFGTLILKLIRGEIIVDGMFSHEYVPIQDIPAYAKERIRKTLEYGWAPDIGYLGHIGAVTKNHIYLKFENGIEWLHDRSGDMREPSFFTEGVDVIDEMLLSKCREYAGDYPVDVRNEDKFKWYRYWEKYVTNYQKTHPINECIRLLNEYFSKKPNGSVAIRSGGEHTVNLLKYVSKDNKKKIALIIDNNKHCVCSETGIKIMTEEEYDSHLTPYILISSFLHGKKLKGDAVKYCEKGVQCTELYEYFNENHINVSQEFYNRTPLKCDLEVGFPFD